ncbi:MAG: SBBP repeat-containing protein [Acidobacteriota bacterium]
MNTPVGSPPTARGNVYVVGGTLSSNFPVAGATQALNAGGQDAFVTKIKTTAPVQIVYSTYLGGTGGNSTAPEQANAVAIDSTGTAYVTGVASSTNFPVTVGAFQSGAGGGRDVFVTRFNAAGTARIYSTFLGWAGFDWGTAIAVDGVGNAYVAGYTSSTSFANVGGVQPAFAGQYDGFVSKLTPGGTHWLSPRSMEARAPTKSTPLPWIRPATSGLADKRPR